MSVELPLSKGYIALIDDSDADLACFKWSANVGSNTVYACRVSRKVFIALHRSILSRVLERELLHNETVDHIDGNGLNNCRANLRLASHNENMKNTKRHRNNKSGYKGVCWNTAVNRWSAYICADRRRYYLGSFDTPELAHQAYCIAAQELHGEFARME